MSENSKDRWSGTICLVWQSKPIKSTDSSHVRFIVKGTRTECGQEFLTTNYPDLLIRDTVINGALDSSLITLELPKDELKLSNFITNRDDFIYHEISCNLRREFASVLHDECKENFCKMKSEHFLDHQIPNFHTYRLGGSNYLTESGEVAYFYKCRPRLVAAIQAQTCYVALLVEVAQNNYTLTSFKREDGEQVIAPRYYIEPLTHQITSVAKKVPCLSQFFARYKDIFGRWFAVTPQISITDPPGTLDFESLQKRANLIKIETLAEEEFTIPKLSTILYRGLKGTVTKKWLSTNWLTKLVILNQVNISHPNWCFRHTPYQVDHGINSSWVRFGESLVDSAKCSLASPS